MSDLPEVKQTLRGAEGRSRAWYRSEIQSLQEPARHLFENYSHIPSDKVIPHIIAVRDRAWDIWPYPCLGKLNFLDLSISQSPTYTTILAQLIKSNHTLLDLGCCFAQDLRQLVVDGAPSANLYGLELRQAFVDLGYELFQDKTTLKSTFLVGNVLDDTAPDGLLKGIIGRIDIIYAASIFHLFDWAKQLELAKRVAMILKPVPGSLVLGRQRGNVKPGEYEHRTNEHGTMFRHNEESFREMWAKVEEWTGIQWDVKVTLQRDEDFGDAPVTDDRRLYFEVKRR